MSIVLWLAKYSKIPYNNISALSVLFKKLIFQQKMVKKAVISAAGKGTRMLHLTKKKSKHAIEVKGKPFIYYLLESIKKAGISNIIVVVGYKKDVLADFLKKYDEKIRVIDQYEMVPQKYGTACPVKAAQQAVGQEQFLSFCGDGLYSIKDIQSMMIDDQYNYVAGITMEQPANYGVLVKDAEGNLKKIVEKPKEFVGKVINTGLYKFTPEIFTKIDQVKVSERGEYEITDAITMLARENKVKVQTIKDFWLDFTKPEDIIQVDQYIQANNLNG